MAISYTSYYVITCSIVVGGSGWGNVTRTNVGASNLSQVYLTIAVGSGGSYAASSCHLSVITIGV